MRSLISSRSHCWTLGLVVLISILLSDFASSQEGRNRGGSRRRDDPTSFLSVLKDDKFAATLKLTPEQSEQLAKLRMQRYDLIDKIKNRDELAQARKELDDKAIILLTEEQKAIWQKRKGEASAEQAKTDAGSSDSGSKTSNSNSSTTTGVERAESTQPATGTASPNEKPEGGTTVISFGAAAAEKAADNGNKPKPQVVAKENGVPNDKMLSFNFQFAPWSDVLKLFADVNGLTLDLNDVPPGTFNYYDEQQYTMTEALDILNGYLISKGYILVRRDRFLVCLNIIDNPIPPNVIPNVTEEELLHRGNNELLSLVFPLEGGLDAEKVVSEVSQLLGPYGKAHALKSTNSLVLTDIGSYLRRVSQLLKSSKPIDNRDTSFRAIALKHILAADAERIVRRHFGLNPVVSTPAQPTFGGRGGGFGRGGGGYGGGGYGDGGGRDGGGRDGQQAQPPAPTTNSTAASPFAGKIQVTADTRGNYLLVTAKADLIKVIDELVTKLDSNTDSTGRAVELKNSPSYFQPYSVPGSDVLAISRMLSNMFPGTIVGEDARSGKIFVQGTKEEHQEIQRLIKSSSGGSSDAVVFPLLKLDPAQVTNTLRSLFSTDVPRAPSIEFDANGRRILVRGTPDQLSQIRSVLKELGEVSVAGGAEGGDPSVQVDRGTVRKLNMSGHDPEEILGMLQKTWDATGHSPFRIVVPSRSSPIKDRRVPGAAPPALESKSNEAEPPQVPKRPLTNSDVKKPTEPGTTIRIENRRKDPEKPRDVRPNPRVRTTTTRLYPRRMPVIQVSQTESDVTTVEPDGTRVEPIADVNREREEKSAIETPREVALFQNADDETPSKPKMAKAKPNSGTDKTNEDPTAPVGVTISGNDVILTSPDTQALDQLEDMLNALLSSIPQRTRWTVFNLRTADATESAQMIERLFPQTTVAATPSANEGFLGGLTGQLSSFGRGMMNATGLNQTLGGSQNLKIVTDVRANALFVTGPRDVLHDIEELLTILDSGDVPAMRDRVPHTIPVEYADIEEVAAMVEELFKDSMSPEPAQQGNQGNPFAAMFGGNRGGGAPAAKKGIELSLTIDKRTSHLIVSCNETMFRRIDDMVQELDLRAKNARPTVRLVPLKTADPMVVQSTLTSLMPRVTVGATRTKREKKPDAAAAATPGQQGQNRGQDANRDAEMFQRMMQRGNGQPGGGIPGVNQGGGQRGNGGGGGNFRGGGGGGNGGRGRGNGGGQPNN